jgi:Cof subfamily protein (haloacid dehalogenase superfamily)
MGKFLFFDIDGTLTDSDHGIQWPSQSTLDAIHQAQKNGHRCLICSGRNLSGLQQYLALNMDGYIFSDGGGIYFPGKEPILEPIPDDLLEYLIQDVVHHRKGEIILSAMQTMYCSEQEYIFMSAFADQVEQAGGKMAVCQLEEYNGEPVMESDVGFASQAIEDAFMRDLPKGLEFVSTTASYGRGERTSGEVTKRGVNKGAGIRKAVHLLNGSMEDTFGFGDSMNDASMLKACHTGIAMGNGAQELKNLADYVTGDIQDDGLADAMRHFGLI